MPRLDDPRSSRTPAAAEARETAERPPVGAGAPSCRMRVAGQPRPWPRASRYCCTVGSFVPASQSSSSGEADGAEAR